MNIFIYGSYVSDSKETIEERIFEDIACNVKSIAKVETMTEYASDDIEEETASVKGVFDLMRNGYIFLDMCGKE